MTDSPVPDPDEPGVPEEILEVLRELTGGRDIPPAMLQQLSAFGLADADPAHAAFDMMRTRLLRTLRANGWTSVGVTSPTSGTSPEAASNSFCVSGVRSSSKWLCAATGIS